MGLLFWIVAVIMAIAGVVQLVQSQMILGIVLLIVAAGVGPGGWSFFRRKSA